MMYGLEAITVPQHIKTNLIKWTPSSINIDIKPNAIMWAVDGMDDASVSFAARLMEQNINVRIVDKDIYLSGESLSRGVLLSLAWTIQMLIILLII